MPGPADEGAEEVDAVGRPQLGPQLRAQRRLLGRVGEQRRRRQRRDRPLQPVHPGSDLPAEDGELLRGAGKPLLGPGDPVEQVVDQGQPTAGVAHLGQRPRDDIGDVPAEHVRGVGRLDRCATRGETDELSESGVKTVGAQGLVDAFGKRVRSRGLARRSSGAVAPGAGTISAGRSQLESVARLTRAQTADDGHRVCVSTSTRSSPRRPPSAHPARRAGPLAHRSGGCHTCCDICARPLNLCASAVVTSVLDG